jgi:Zn-dependent protease
MQGSLKLGRLGGIEIGVHYSWLFAFALIAWSLAVGYYPAHYRDWTPSTYWLLGTLSALGLFASVLIHELSHSFVALARGHGVRGITLFIFGGVSQLEGEPEAPRDEFLISLVGPLTSFALAGVFWAATRLLAAGDSPLGGMLAYLTVINLLLGGFNLLPGFPLDGGRILRSAIWGATGDAARATRIASYVGQGFGFLFIFLGVSQVLRGNFLGGLWIAFIGWFLNGAAESVRQERALREGLQGVRVGDVMNRELPVASPRMTVEELVLEHVLRRGQRALLVLEDGRLAGIVSITDAKEVPPAAWATTPVAAVMTRPPLKTVSATIHLDEALRLLVDGSLNQLPVVERDRPVGLLGRADVLRFLQLRATLGPTIARR